MISQDTRKYEEGDKIVEKLRRGLTLHKTTKFQADVYESFIHINLQNIYRDCYIKNKEEIIRRNNFEDKIYCTYIETQRCWGRTLACVRFITLALLCIPDISIYVLCLNLHQQRLKFTSVVRELEYLEENGFTFKYTEKRSMSKKTIIKLKIDGNIENEIVFINSQELDDCGPDRIPRGYNLIVIDDYLTIRGFKGNNMIHCCYDFLQTRSCIFTSVCSEESKKYMALNDAAKESVRKELGVDVKLFWYNDKTKENNEKESLKPWGINYNTQWLEFIDEIVISDCKPASKT